MDRFTSLVTPYAIIVVEKSSNKNATYITSVDELGLTNKVNIEPTIANTIRKLAMNMVVSMVTRPKNKRCNPIMKSTIPIKIQLSLNTCQRLETSKTGHPYREVPWNSSTFS